MEKNPFVIFLGSSASIILLTFLANSTAGASLAGTLAGSMTDPLVISAGVALGLVENRYRRFAMIVYPASGLIAIFGINLLVNPWLQEVRGYEAEGWVYFLKAYSILFVAHCVGLLKYIWLQYRSGLKE